MMLFMMDLLIIIGIEEDEGEAVIVWRGPKGNNGHATTKLDMKTWETAKS